MCESCAKPHGAARTKSQGSRSTSSAYSRFDAKPPRINGRIGKFAFCRDYQRTLQAGTLFAFPEKWNRRYAMNRRCTMLVRPIYHEHELETWKWLAIIVLAIALSLVLATAVNGF